MTYAWPAHTHTHIGLLDWCGLWVPVGRGSAVAHVHCQCASGSDSQVAGPSDHRATRTTVPCHRQGLRGASRLPSIVLTCTMCVSRSCCCSTLDNKQRTALIGISASTSVAVAVAVADFCASFGAWVSSSNAKPFVHLTDNSTHCCSISVCVKHSLHFASLWRHFLGTFFFFFGSVLSIAA